MLPCLKVSRKQIFQILVCRSRYFLFSFKITRFINIKTLLFYVFLFISFKFRPPWRDNNTFVRWHFTVSDTTTFEFSTEHAGKKNSRYFYEKSRFCFLFSVFMFCYRVDFIGCFS
uniref:Uncharacterized protein n=1 Tax=Cacopsylla melanoneura TaxID=428564 RepID=A0A8D9AC99_9HEMI